MSDLRTLQVKPETKERFLELGKMSDTQDSVLARLLDEHRRMGEMRAFWDKYHEYESELETMIRTNEIMEG